MPDFVGTIKGIERRDNSRIGNPAYVLLFETGSHFRTAPNISDAFIVDAWGCRIGDRVELTLDKLGRIETITPMFDQIANIVAGR